MEEPSIQKLLISTVSKRKNLSSIPLKYPTQLKPFYLGLKIKNLNDKATSPGTLKNLILKPGEGTSIHDTIYEELSFRQLNPNEEVIMWWPEPIMTVQRGQIWIECNVIPVEQNVKFETFQRNPHSPKPVPSAVGNNKWGDGFFIIGKIESQQNWTNFLMFLLTLLVFLDGVWGLNILFKGLFTEFGKIFSLISLFFTKLGGS